MRFELEDAPRGALMRVIGVGGAGGNAVNRMIDEQLEGVDFISANTDAQALAQARAPKVIQLGKKLTRGLGAGAQPGIGRQAVAEDADEVRSALEGADLVFIAAGMGGGTGTGAAPVIGSMAREMGALTVAIVSRPFSFEGPRRARQAEQGLKELRRNVDTLVVVPNDRVLAVAEKGATVTSAFKKADEVLLHATQGISDLIRLTGIINVDFADVRTIMSSSDDAAMGGGALMGTGEGTGEDRAAIAARAAVESPLLDNVSIRGATGVLINITGGTDMALDEVTEISSMIQEEAGDAAEIIFGAVEDSSMDGQLRVTLIATGFDENGRATREPRIVKGPFVKPAGPVEEPDGSVRLRRAANDSPRRQPVHPNPRDRSPLSNPTDQGNGNPIGQYGPQPQPQEILNSPPAPMPGPDLPLPPTQVIGAKPWSPARPPLSKPEPQNPPQDGRPDRGGMFRTANVLTAPRELELPTFIRRFEA